MIPRGSNPAPTVAYIERYWGGYRIVQPRGAVMVRAYQPTIKRPPIIKGPKPDAERTAEGGSTAPQ